MNERQVVAAAFVNHIRGVGKKKKPFSAVVEFVIWRELKVRCQFLYRSSLILGFESQRCPELCEAASAVSTLADMPRMLTSAWMVQHVKCL